MTSLGSLNKLKGLCSDHLEILYSEKRKKKKNTGLMRMVINIGQLPEKIPHLIHGYLAKQIMKE